MSAVPQLQIDTLRFAHDAQVIVSDVSLQMHAGEIVVIVGPSGCGKTTLLRLIAGLERPGSGSISLDGEQLSTPTHMVSPEERPVGMVFQGLALFPHLTVRKNIGFGLFKLPKAERTKLVNAELISVGLEGLGDRFPHQLSGGQQQRVAIARSLIMRPKVLLMDEPFSDLDAHTRGQVRTEVLRILREHGVTAIIVSHDREDAYHLGDRIAVMDQGKITRLENAAVLRTEWVTKPFTL